MIRVIRKRRAAGKAVRWLLLAATVVTLGCGHPDVYTGRAQKSERSSSESKAPQR